MPVMASTRSPSRTPASPIALAPMVAALSVALNGQGASSPEEIQLLPAGEFRSATDDRPKDVPTWRIDGEIASRLIQRFTARNRRLVIDYEHQTLAAATNGQPAPASGWITGLQWREGQGLYAQVTWTARARAHIDAEEYLYISPVFPYDKEGRPLDILHAALTNDPALGGMDPVRLAQMSRVALSMAHSGASTSPAQSLKDHDMDQLLKALFALLGLPEGATEDEALAKLAEYVRATESNAAQVADLTAKVEEKGDEVAALKANGVQVDLSKYVPIAALTTIQNQVAEMTKNQTTRDVEEVVVAAMSAGQIPPALEAWARELGTSNLPALKKYVAEVTPIAALSGTQTQGKSPIGEGKNITEDELAVCRNLGLSPEAYIKQRG